MTSRKPTAMALVHLKKKTQFKSLLWVHTAFNGIKTRQNS